MNTIVCSVCGRAIKRLGTDTYFGVMCGSCSSLRCQWCYSTVDLHVQPCSCGEARNVGFKAIKYTV